MTKENDSTAMVQVNNDKNVPINCFGTLAGFEAGQRIANMFSQSNLVPNNFKGDIGSCLIALNMANRMGADPLQVMQSLYIVHGKPSFSSAFLIACFNRCGRFSTIRYRMQGTKGKDNWGCVAYSTELATGELVEGVEVTIGMAKAEGWWSKKDRNGNETSKWQTMPELMLRYRAATFLIRSVAPDIALGFPTTEEAIDITDQTTVVSNTTAPSTLDEVAKAAVAEQAKAAVAEQAKAAEPVTVEQDIDPLPEDGVVEVEAQEVEPADKGQDFTTKYFKEHHIAEKHGK